MLPSFGVWIPLQFAPPAASVTAVVLWGASDFAGGLGSRKANPFVLTAFSHVCAFALMLLVALAQRETLPDRVSILWALLAGGLGGFSLAVFYGALASGQMGLTAPIGALLGAAIPTLVDIALEGSPSRWSIAGFVLAIVAIWLITRPEPQGENDATGHPRGVAIAALAGVGFAGFYLCIHQATGIVRNHSRRRAGDPSPPETRRSPGGSGYGRRILGHHRERVIHFRQPARPSG